MASVKLVNLVKRFGKVTAVSDMNMEIADKEFLVFVGPSGCGKTTALRMIAGLEEITEGQIFVDNRIVNDVPPKDRDIAMVFQNYALYPHMSVFDNMAFGLKLRKVPRAEIKTRVGQAADILGLSEYLKRKPKELSGGQRQRVALARAIVRQPKVFLMDEPLSNLDAKLRVHTRAELIRLHRDLGITTIYVTHDQVEAMTMGNRMAVMNAGVVQQVDTPLNCYHHPENKFVAGFIGSPAMNFIDAKLDTRGDTVIVDCGDFVIPLTPSIASQVKSYVGKKIVFGIRPEDIFDRTLTPTGLSNLSEIIPMTVDVMEPLGSYVYTYLKTKSFDLISSLDSDTKALAGDKLDVVFDLDHCHLFDSETEASLINLQHVEMKPITA